MSGPGTEAGRAAVVAINSGALALWSGDPAIDSMIAAVEREARAAALAAVRELALRLAVESIPHATGVQVYRRKVVRLLDAILADRSRE